MDQNDSVDAPAAGQSAIWASVAAARRPRLHRPRDVPRPESVDEVAAWADHGTLRRTEFVYAPVFWLLLPLAALGFLVHQTITDPTGAGWNITVNGEHRDSWPTWAPWLAWIGVVVWLLVAVGVLVVRLSILRDLRAESRLIYRHGVAHSIHRASVDFDDGEGRWATYIALDHRLDDTQAARIFQAFDQWLHEAGMPPQGSDPISSDTLFGARAAGGYFMLYFPGSQTSGETTEHQWVLITEPHAVDDDAIFTLVPTPKTIARIRRRLHRRARRSAP